MHARNVLAGLACAALAMPAQAGELDDDYGEMSLEDLLQVSVTTKSALSDRESPGIVSVITREEIRDSGARDLDDVLRLVPGFDFGLDYYGTVGMAMRGVWGIEGKILLLLDGVPVNELTYNSALIGNRVPMDQIEKIEIIRGPGSVIYGGAAELGVVNLVTQTGAQLNGVQLTGQHGQYAHEVARDTLSLSYGQRFGKKADDLDVTVQLYAGEAQRSDRAWMYPDGTVVNGADGAYAQLPRRGYVSVGWKGLSARFLVDRAPEHFLDATGAPLTRPSLDRFDNVFAEVKYEWKPAANVTITPQYDFATSNSYGNDDVSATSAGGASAAADIGFDIVSRKHRASVTAQMTPARGLDLLVGGEYVNEHASSPSGALTFDPANPNDFTDHYDTHSWAGYGQAMWKTPFATLTAGVRGEWQSATDAFSVVPRVALTKTFDKLHVKLLYSRAFRTPSLANLNEAASTGVYIHPERTRTMEAEVGYRFTARQQLVINAFDTTVFGPIVYVGEQQTYDNFAQTGSRGVEAEYRINAAWGSARLNYSFYSTDGINRVPLYTVAQDPAQLAGFSPHKVTLSGTVKLLRNVRLSPSVVFLGKRYSWIGTDGSGTLATQPVDATLLANLFLSVSDVGVRGLELGAGVYNILGADYSYPTAYDFGRNPLPGQSREFLFRLSYRYGL